MKKLTDDRKRLALAKVGIEALIDEATGYQQDRPKNALRRRLRRHVKAARAEQDKKEAN